MAQILKSALSAVFRAFEFEEFFFPRNAGAEPAEAGFRDDSMARHHDEQPIRSDGRADAARGAGTAKLGGDLSVRHHFTGRNFHHPLPNAASEIRRISERDFVF